MFYSIYYIEYIYIHIYIDQKSTSQFNLADVSKSFYHVIFLEVCKSYQIVPDELYVEIEPCIGNLIRNF